MDPIQELKASVQEALPNLDMLIGWEQGFDPLHATPAFIKDSQDVDNLVWNPLCVQNLAVYLPWLKDKKVGVCVKGCDSRSVVQLLQEGLVKRENLTVFGLSCSGVLDLKKVQAQVPAAGTIQAVDFQADQVRISTRDKTYELQKSELLPRKCLSCQYPNPVLADHSFGQQFQPADKGYFDLEEFETKSLQDRLDYWRHHLQRCIRCYACRNACPLCACRDHCIAQTRNPHWLSEDNNIQQNLMYQMIHAQHLAGRCTDCGECERVCPMDIPVLTLKRKLNQIVQELFDYQAGLDQHAVPPLLTFQVEEQNKDLRGE
ncbi:MAG: 4Fe-4S dicluster domain-containing protein [Desulfohalobiaceae bacterium]